MTEKFDTHGWYRELASLGNEAEYEAFLRRQSIAKDHSFLLASISRSNLNPAVRNVVEDLIKFGKILGQLPDRLSEFRFVQPWIPRPQQRAIVGDAFESLETPLDAPTHILVDWTLLGGEFGHDGGSLHVGEIFDLSFHSHAGAYIGPVTVSSN